MEKKASLAPPAPLYHSYLHGDGRPRQDQGKVTTSCWKLLPKGVYRTDYAGVPRRLNRRGCCKGNLIFLLGLISLHAWPSFILLRSHYSTIQDMLLPTFNLLHSFTLFGASQIRLFCIDDKTDKIRSFAYLK